MKLATQLIFLLTLALPFFTLAQTAPEFMVSWRADSYVPPGYEGKALPSAGTRVTMSVELVDNGRLVDLSNQEIRWLINSRDLQAGLGRQTISLVVDSIRSSQKVYITIADYKGANISHLVTIPRVPPEVVITSLAPGQIISPGLHMITGRPFFFNVEKIGDLEFFWSANGETLVGSDNLSQIELDTTQVPGGSRINLALLIRNIMNPRENASRSIILTSQ